MITLLVALLALPAAALGARLLQSRAEPPKRSVPALTVAPRQPGDPRSSDLHTQPGLAWRLNMPHPAVVPEARSAPEVIADRRAARIASMEARALLRAYEGAPPVIPHSTEGMNIQTCRACHAEGLVAGGKVARMVSHAYLPSCTQCHVEAAGALLVGDPDPPNEFVGWRGAGVGGARAWDGAPPAIPHTVFMRTNCTSCHGEHGYEGWRPDHLWRSSCVQCHAPAAELEQLSPAFGLRDAPGGVRLREAE